MDVDDLIVLIFILILGTKPSFWYDEISESKPKEFSKISELTLSFNALFLIFLAYLYLLDLVGPLVYSYIYKMSYLNLTKLTRRWFLLMHSYNLKELKFHFTISKSSCFMRFCAWQDDVILCFRIIKRQRIENFNFHKPFSRYGLTL